MTNRQVLLLIATFVALTLGSFIWFIATWDNRQANVQTHPFILAETLLPETPKLARGMML
ncbi:hypothetical protein [Yoonia sp.]|uniref:hypothetical protein n=1 Tax=Yoonia sp. TaxID=2212373 RepID=UPI003976135C